MTPSKSDLRSAVRRCKQSMTPEEIRRRSDTLCRKVLQTDHYRDCKTIYGYLPFNQEVDLLPLLQQAQEDGKQVALPKCVGREMVFILVSDLSRIQYSSFGAPEPVANDPIAHDESALVILPGLVFDRRGYRIGYGGGYYDRFLALEPNHPTIALCYDFQLYDALEPEPHDIPAHMVLSV